MQNYEQDKNQRMIDFGNLERKFNEISEKERVSTTELAKILKKEASERDTLKRKLVELETRLKENQTTNMNNNLLIEKERSKWGMEKSELSEKLRDQIDYSKTMK